MKIIKDMYLESIICISSKNYAKYAHKNIDPYRFKNYVEIEDEYKDNVYEIVNYLNNTSINSIYKSRILNDFEHSPAFVFLLKDSYPDTIDIVGPEIKKSRYPGYAIYATFNLDNNGIITNTILLNTSPTIKDGIIKLSQEEFRRLFTGSTLFTAQAFLNKMGLLEKDWEINQVIKNINIWQNIHEEFLYAVIATKYAIDLENGSEIDEQFSNQLGRIFNIPTWVTHKIYDIANNDYSKTLKK